MPELLTVRRVATILGISEAQVKELMRRRGLPYITGIGKGRRVLDEDLWDWVRLQRVMEEDEEDELTREG